MSYTWVCVCVCLWNDDMEMMGECLCEYKIQNEREITFYELHFVTCYGTHVSLWIGTTTSSSSSHVSICDIFSFLSWINCVFVCWICDVFTVSLPMAYTYVLLCNPKSDIFSFVYMFCVTEIQFNVTCDMIGNWWIAQLHGMENVWRLTCVIKSPERSARDAFAIISLFLLLCHRRRPIFSNPSVRPSVCVILVCFFTDFPSSSLCV